MNFAQLLEDGDNLLGAIAQFEQTAQAVTGFIPEIGPTVTLATDATTGTKAVLDGVLKGLKFTPPATEAPQNPS